MKHAAPPRLAQWLLGRVLSDDVASRTISADLAEEFAYRTGRSGLRQARAWYWRAVLGMSFGYRGRRAPKGASFMDSLGQDVRFAMRTLRKSPGFTVAVLLTLTVGIGASTAIFSMLNAVVLRPLPYTDPDRLMFLSEMVRDGETMTISWPNFLDWKREQKSFETLAGSGQVTFNMTGGGGAAERLVGRAVNWDFLRMLGVNPALGRDFIEEDDRLGVDHRILISHDLWMRRFGGDPGVLGRQVTLDAHQHTVIGVLPQGFTYVRPYDVFEPFTVRTGPDSPYPSRGNHNALFAVGRLKPGVTQQAAQAEMSAIAASLEKAYPDTNGGVGVLVEPLVRRIVGELRPTLYAMFAAVGFLLLIACVNVTNLQVARGAARQHELAVRAALGSGRARLMRQLMVESLLLALAGGVLAIGFGAGMLRVLLALAPEGLPRLDEVSLDAAAALFAFGAVLLAGLVFGMLPALHASRKSGQQALVRSSRTAGGATAMRVRRGLIVAETALALILLTGAGLMVRTMQQLSAVDTGFDATNLVTARFTISAADWDTPRRRLFYQELDERVRALPGVKDAALSMSLPIEGSGWGSVFIVGDRPAPPTGQLPSAHFSPITQGYFSTLGLRVLSGRPLGPGDGGENYAVVVNETFAKRFWPDGNAVGQRLKQGFADWTTPWREIVGVVNDIKMNGVAEETPLHVYTPLSQDTGRTINVIARTSIDPKAVQLSLANLVREMNGDIPVYNATTLETLLSESTARQRVTAAILTIFAVVALLLAAIGLFGIVSHGVTERTPEIGVRLALGATSSAIVRLFVRNGLVTAAVGIVIGALGAYWLTRFLEELLFGVEPLDRIAFATGAGVLFLVALVACYVPASRAARVSPTVALRGD
jgi:putative ABC transport system permease protein